jgi:hypothetical protein
MRLARSSLRAVVMPSDRLILPLDKKGFMSFEEVERKVEEIRVPYEGLWNDTENFCTHFPNMSVETILDVMDSCDRIKPLGEEEGIQEGRKGAAELAP